MPKQLHDTQLDVKEGEKLQSFDVTRQNVSFPCPHTNTETGYCLTTPFILFFIKKKKERICIFKLQPTGSLEPAIAYPSYATQIS